MFPVRIPSAAPRPGPIADATGPPSPSLRLDALSPDEPLHHARHGEGRFVSLRTTGSGMTERQAVVLRTERRGSLTVPVDTLHVLQRSPCERDRFVVDLDLGPPSLLPRHYVPDENRRLALCLHLSAAANDWDVDRCVAMLNRRYGDLPVQARALVVRARVRWRCERLRIAGVCWRGSHAELDLTRMGVDTRLRVARLAAQRPRRWAITDDETLIRQPASGDERPGARTLLALLDRLGADA